MKQLAFRGCPAWFKVKGYPHFDLKIRSRATAMKWVRYIEDPKKIKTHQFFPFIKNELKVFRRKPDAKGDHYKRRPIMYASHGDANVYSRYGAMLSERYEELISTRLAKDSVLAYRRLGPSINNVSFSQSAFEEIRRRGTCVAIAFDVTKFFDTLDHEILRQQWSRVLGEARLPDDHFQVYRSLTRFSYVERKALCKELRIKRKQERKLDRYCDPATFRAVVRKSGLIQQNPDPFGIPQGSPMSAVLSNIYMLEADENLAAFMKAIGGSYRRYCDDILVICNFDDLDRTEAMVKVQLKQLGLEINAKKTETSVFVQRADGSQYVAQGFKPLQYLGFVFDGNHVRIRSQSLARYYRKMKSGVRAAAQSAKRKPVPTLPKAQLYTNYTHLGRRNFYSYARGAGKVMSSKAIGHQLGRHWEKLKAEINDRQAIVIKSKKPKPATN